MSLLHRFREGLARTRGRLGAGMAGWLGLRAVDAEARAGLEEALLAADVGPDATDRLIARAEARMRREGLDLGEALRRAVAEMLSARPGADPASVVHDGLASAVGRRFDVVLIDTAGRLHTKHNLMAELEK